MTTVLLASMIRRKFHFPASSLCSSRSLLSLTTSSHSSRYFFSSSSKGTKDDEPPSPSTVLASAFIDTNSRSIGQVIFLNSSKSGQAILLSLAIGDPTLSVFAALGAATANASAQLCGLEANSLENGLWGYNGALIGCAASAFGPSFFPLAVTSTLVGAAATPLLAASLKKTLSIPQWTWSFNAIALTSLLQSRPLIQNTVTVENAIENTTGIVDLALSPIVGISQIFVVESYLTGAGIIGAIGMYSPKLALHALGGSVIGSIIGIFSGADVSNVAMGLWGYNSALTSMAVGTFFVNSREAIALSAFGAASSAALFGAMQPVFGMHGVPCLTLPFCTVASVCFLLEGQVPGLALAKDPHSPEKNV